MSFLAGFVGGQAKSAGDLSHKLLDVQLKKTAGLVDLYKSIGSNPNFHPDVQKEAINRATTLQSIGAFDFKTPKKLSNFKELFEMSDQLGTNDITNQLAGSQYTGRYPDPGTTFTGGMRNPDLEYQRDLHKTEATAEIQNRARTDANIRELEERQRLLVGEGNELGGSDLDQWRAQLQSNKALLGSAAPSATDQVVPYLKWQSIKTGQQGEGPAVYLRGKWFNASREEVMPLSQLHPGATTTQSTTRNAEGVRTGTVSTRTPNVGGGVTPVAGAASVVGAQPQLAQPPPMVAQPPAQPMDAPPLQAPLQGPSVPQPAAVAPPVTPELTPNQWVREAIPGDDPMSQQARQFATMDKAMHDLAKKSEYILSQMVKKMREASIYVPSEKELAAIKDFDRAKLPMNAIGYAMKRVQTDPLNPAELRVLHGMVMSLGSLLAKDLFQQSGLLSNQEQVWARMAFAGALESMAAGLLDKGGNPALIDAARMNLEFLADILNENKMTTIQGRADQYTYIAGHGRVDEYIAPFDPMAVPRGLQHMETATAPPDIKPETLKYINDFRKANGLEPVGPPASGVTAKEPYDPQKAAEETKVMMNRLLAFTPEQMKHVRTFPLNPQKEPGFFRQMLDIPGNINQFLTQTP